MRTARPIRITALILVLLLVLLGGCSGVETPTGPTSEPTTTVSVTTVSATTVPVTTLGTTAYPERPASLSEETVRAFVVDCERAHLQNEGNTMATKISATIDASIEETATGDFVAALHVEAVVRYADGHGDVEHDAHYFVNDSAVLRAEVAPGESAPDPRNGTAVPCG